MASGRMDLILSPIPANVVSMNLNGLGAEDRSLAQVGSGRRVTMKHGRRSESVIVQIRDDAESFVNLMEMNAALAKKLKLQASRRYRLQYNSNNNELSAVPSPVSSARATLRTAAAGLSPRSVNIGYALRQILGIPEERGFAINLRSGRLQRRLSIYTPGNLFDRGFRLSPATSRSLFLPVETPLTLTYDQRTKTLSADVARDSAANKQTGDA